MKRFSSVAVTGAHGKTSTTGLLAHVISGSKPTSFLIGDGTGKVMWNAEYFYSKRVNMETFPFLFSRLCYYDEYRF